MAQSGGVRQSSAMPRIALAVVGEVVAHVVQKQIGVRVNGLIAHLQER